MSTPLVSICMPAYNIEKYIAETINSIIDQTYKNWELIIVDDGSTDNTLLVAKKFESDQIKIISQTNSGASTSRNNAFLNSKGDFIKFMDADDLLNPEMIENQVKLAIVNDDCIISSKWGRFYNDDLKTFKLSFEKCWQTSTAFEWICNSWTNFSPMTQPGIFLIPRKIIEISGLWDQSLSLLDDPEYFHRTILNCKQIVFSDNSILYYRSGINGLSGGKTYAHALSAYNAMDKVTATLFKFDNSNTTRQLCANIWQSLIYGFELTYPDLLLGAKQKVSFYGGSTLKPRSPKYKNIIKRIIGDRLIKTLQKCVYKKTIHFKI